MQRVELEDQIRTAVLDYNSLPDAVGTDVSAYIAEHVFNVQRESERIMAEEYESALRHAEMYRRHREDADSMLAELVTQDFADEIAYALAVRHKCLEHSGPGSGPCRTDRERANIVRRLIAAKTNTRLESRDDDPS